MTRVLMCSNDQTFSPALTHAYHARGLDVVAGISNLDPAFGAFDVIHLHWPEELVGWGTHSASPARTARALALLDWWSERAVLVATVHNLVPHHARRLDGPEADYFRAFYERADLICHFSEYSRERYREVYPSLAPDRQICHPLNSYDHLLPLARGRQAARAALGLDPDAPVFALCGAMRKREEMTLVRSAWRRLSRRDARLLLASRPALGSMGLASRTMEKTIHRIWSRDARIRTLDAHPDDEALVRIVEAADALLVPRIGHHLNSGLIPLALTFGTGVVAPDRGPNREIVPLPANELYDAQDPVSFAAAMDRQAAKSAQAVRDANLAHGRMLGWDGILERIWPRVVGAGRAKGLAAFPA